MMWANWDSALGVQTTQPVPAAGAPKVQRWSMESRKTPTLKCPGCKAGCPRWLDPPDIQENLNIQMLSHSSHFLKVANYDRLNWAPPQTHILMF